MSLKGLVVFCMLLFASPGGIEHTTLSEGITGSFSPAQNIVVKNQDELRKVWTQLGIKSEVPSVDFSDELVVVIVSRGKLASSTEVWGAEKKSDHTVEVRYVVRPFRTEDLNTGKPGMFPYIVTKLYPLDVQKTNVKFVEDIPLPPVPKDSGIGQVPSYTNVLKDYENADMALFLPLDKGNSWTYRVESTDKSGEETYSIISISQDGWSVFDRFFGQKSIAMRVDPSGNVLVSSEKGVQSFYTDDVGLNLDKSQFSTPAGMFDDLMVATLPENGQFWFKDVYAKGIGLIYHERKSPKGVVKYTLVKAKVKGTNYPSVSN